MTDKKFELYGELHSTIFDTLQVCDSQKMPTICALRANKTEAEKLTQMVIDRVAKEGKTIMGALLEIENEYNINKNGE